MLPARLANDVTLQSLLGNGPVTLATTPCEAKFDNAKHGPLHFLPRAQAGGADAGGNNNNNNADDNNNAAPPPPVPVVLASTAQIIVANARQVAPAPGKLTRFALAYGVAAAIATSDTYAPIYPLGVEGRFADDLAEADRVPLSDIQAAHTDAVTLIGACKTQFHKTNHHTGGDVATGFALKVLKLIGVDNPTKDETTFLWRIGHWFDTRTWLSALGVKGLQVTPARVNALKNRVVCDEATQKRITSSPAGTAPFMAVYTAILNIRAHPVASRANAPRIDDWAEWVAVADDIAANAAAYHIGAQYLTGNVRMLPPVVPDAVTSFCATCIRFINRNSTLARAPVFANVADDTTVLSALRNASAFKKHVAYAVGILAHGTSDDKNAVEAERLLRIELARNKDVAGRAPAAEEVEE